jgi:hypothetical protein
MTFKRKIHFVVFVLLGFVAELFLLGYLATNVLGADGPSKQNFYPASLPERNHLHLISTLPVTVAGEILGRAAVYDDFTTLRSADYLELYTSTDTLVAVIWFDRYGIRRIVVDRGLLEGKDELQGILCCYFGWRACLKRPLSHVENHDSNGSGGDRFRSRGEASRPLG